MTRLASITARERHRLARDLLLGAPVAALGWLLIIRMFSGDWSWIFPAIIMAVSLTVASLALIPGMVGNHAFRFWKTLIFCIDWVVTRLCCAFLYFIIFTPMGLLLRMVRVPLLDMKPDRSRSSYWIKSSPRQASPRQFLRQF